MTISYETKSESRSLECLGLPIVCMVLDWGLLTKPTLARNLSLVLSFCSDWIVLGYSGALKLLR